MGAATRQVRLAFLAAFLNDQTTRLLPQHPRDTKYAGLCVASEFPKIRVQDFAAMEIAFLPGVSGRPVKEWSDEQWAQYRTTVRAALQKEQADPAPAPAGAARP